MDRQLIHVGTIGKPHGIGGHVRVHAHVENPEDLQRFGELIDEQGFHWFLTWVGKNVAVLHDADRKPLIHRNEAEKLVNRKLFAHKNCLPELGNDEYYFNDLIGLTAKLLTDTGAETVLGNVAVVHDYGAGVSLEINDVQGNYSIVPFTKQCIPEVNVKAGYVTVVLPNEIEVPHAQDGGN